MSRNVPLTVVLVFAVLGSSAGCKTDEVTFFNGTSSISAIAINEQTMTPDNSSFNVTLDVPFNYTMDVHYDVRPPDFGGAHVELIALGGTYDANGEQEVDEDGFLVIVGDCFFSNIQRHTPATTRGDFQFTGDFVFPQADCAGADWVELRVRLNTRSVSSPFLLGFDAYLYDVN